MFNAFSPLAGGQLSTYYYDAEYPYDLNGSLDYTRPQTAFAIMPHPATIGAINGLLPQMTGIQIQQFMGGELPNGPWLGDTVPQSALLFAFPNIQGGLAKNG